MGQTVPNPYPFTIINNKCSVQGNDTIAEVDTVCIGEPVNQVVHIGSAQQIFRSCFFFMQSDTQCGWQSSFKFYSPGLKEIDGVFDFTDYSGVYSHDWLGAIWVYVRYCPPQANFNGPTTTCVNECATFFNGSSMYPTNYEWRFVGGTPPLWTDSIPPAICYKDTGTFPVTLIVSNPAGSDTVTKYIHVNAGPLPLPVQREYQLTEGDSVTLPACALGSSYNWVFQQGIISIYDTAITVQPEDGTRYQLKVTESGCAVDCNYTVYVKNGLLLPTAFTPNGDGVNDVFRILNTNIKLLNFSIYNRWGEMVFSTTDITEGWDGVYKDVPQPMSTFVWTCEYVISNTGKRKLAKGNVTLLR
ncbi:MAG: gliding motility-associated C-terminal domain-containing protein [Chitinophagales bacterium]